MFCRINKRKAIIDTEFKMRPDAKHARVDSEFFFLQNPWTMFSLWISVMNLQ